MVIRSKFINLYVTNFKEKPLEIDEQLIQRKMKKILTFMSFKLIIF